MATQSFGICTVSLRFDSYFKSCSNALRSSAVLWRQNSVFNRCTSHNTAKNCILLESRRRDACNASVNVQIRLVMALCVIVSYDL